MAVEIERKFLVNGDAWKPAPSLLIRQGYLNRDPQRTVRVRTSGDQAWVTVKGLTRGATRAEFEYLIPLSDAESLLELSEKPIVEKRRYLVRHGSQIWEVDEFLGSNAGLIVAEAEVEHEKADLDLPPWIGDEVTSDPRYYNSSLSIKPFNEW